MPKIKGGRKLARTGKDKGYYTAQFARTAANKARRAAKRKRKQDAAKKVELETTAA